MGQEWKKKKKEKKEEQGEGETTHLSFNSGSIMSSCVIRNKSFDFSEPQFAEKAQFATCVSQTVGLSEDT